MGVTRLLLLGLFYTIQMQIYVLFCTRLYFKDLTYRGLFEEVGLLLTAKKMDHIMYDVHHRVLSRFFDQVGHETTCASKTWIL